MQTSQRRRARLPFAVAFGVTGVIALTGCQSATGSDEEATIAVTSSDDACQPSRTQAPAGTLRFTVTNTGSQATEFYLLAEDGQQVLGEVEDIGPGLSRDLAVQVTPGTYLLACKPGMVGDGIRTPFTVTG